MDKLRFYLSCLMVLTMAFGLLLVPSAYSQKVLDSIPELEGIGIDEHLGKKIPLDLKFTDQDGHQVTLAEYFNAGKPVILNMVYFDCPMLCNLVLNGMTAGVKQLDWTPGDKFQMVAVSFNPRETYNLAYAKRENYLKALGKPGAENGWAFLAGEESQSKALANALGFNYRYDEKRQEYAHTAAAYILTPDGTISRYLYGIDFNPKDLRMALLEASDGKIGSTLDKLILYCYHYDPDARGYVVMATRVMRIGGVVSIGLLGLFLAVLWGKERRNKKTELPLSVNPNVTGNRR